MMKDTEMKIEIIDRAKTEIMIDIVIIIIITRITIRIEKHRPITGEMMIMKVIVPIILTGQCSRVRLIRKKYHTSSSRSSNYDRHKHYSKYKDSRY